MKKFLYATWCISNNVGDVISSWLVKKITDKILVYVKSDENCVKYMCVGSVLNWAGPNTIIWGSGIANRDDCIPLKLDVRAVRGPISRSRVIESGLVCPEIYGDPSLFLPKFFNPLVEKKYKLGIIPHYVDQFIITSSDMIHKDEINFIDVFDTVEKFVCEIKSCEFIVSSSLHGLIIAQAYDVPTIWFQASDKIGGDGTKFHDYLLSTGQEITQPKKWVDICNSNIDILCKNIPLIELKIDLDLLWQACPFRKE